MLTYEQALEKILNHTPRLKARLLPLMDSLGQVLAKNAEASFAFPSFDNSAVDGFAIGKPFVRHCEPAKQAKLATMHWRIRPDESADLFGGQSPVRRSPRPPKNGRLAMTYKGEIAAGDSSQTSLKAGEAMRVFTGAAVPAGTYAVVMQEAAERMNGSVLISREPKAQENIRFRGEDFPKGQILVKHGTCIEPQHLGVLAAAGYEKVSVYPQPQVAILATGNELTNPGTQLAPGKIYDSNTPLLHALVKKTGAAPVILSKTEDSLSQIRLTIRKGLKQDVLLICGGVSVGKYDFVKKALDLEGVREIFWKVDIKPGKPLFFGKKGNTCIFGLPGNPVSVFITFEEFVKPALLKMQGKMPTAVLKDGVMAQSFSNGSRLHFVRVKIREDRGIFQITPLKGQGSHQVGTLAQANALLKVEPNVKLKKHQTVQIKMISSADGITSSVIASPLPKAGAWRSPVRRLLRRASRSSQ